MVTSNLPSKLKFHQHPPGRRRMHFSIFKALCLLVCFGMLCEYLSSTCSAKILVKDEREQERAPGIAIVGTLDGKVYALNVWTGEMKWNLDSGGAMIWTSVASFGHESEKEPFLANQGSSQCIVESGRRVATATGLSYMPQDIATYPASYPYDDASLAQNSASRAVIAALDGSLYTIKPGHKDIQPLPVSLSELVTRSQPYAASDGLILVGKKDSKVTPIDLETGRLDSQDSADTGVTAASPPKDNPSLRPITNQFMKFLLGRADYVVQAFDPDNGNEVWTSIVSEYLLHQLKSPATTAEFGASDATVAETDRIQFPSITVDSLDPQTKTTMERFIRARCPKTGALLWELELPSAILALYGVSDKGAFFVQQTIGSPTQSSISPERLTDRLGKQESGATLEVNERKKVMSSKALQILPSKALVETQLTETTGDCEMVDLLESVKPGLESYPSGLRENLNESHITFSLLSRVAFMALQKGFESGGIFIEGVFVSWSVILALMLLLVVVGALMATLCFKYVRRIPLLSQDQRLAEKSKRPASPAIDGHQKGFDVSPTLSSTSSEGFSAAGQFHSSPRNSSHSKGAVWAHPYFSPQLSAGYRRSRSWSESIDRSWRTSGNEDMWRAADATGDSSPSQPISTPKMPFMLTDSVSVDHFDPRHSEYFSDFEKEMYSRSLRHRSRGHSITAVEVLPFFKGSPRGFSSPETELLANSSAPNFINHRPPPVEVDALSAPPLRRCWTVGGGNVENKSQSIQETEKRSGLQGRESSLGRGSSQGRSASPPLSEEEDEDLEDEDSRSSSGKAATGLTMKEHKILTNELEKRFEKMAKHYTESTGGMSGGGEDWGLNQIQTPTSMSSNRVSTMSAGSESMDYLSSDSLSNQTNRVERTEIREQGPVNPATQLRRKKSSSKSPQTPAISAQRRASSPPIGRKVLTKRPSSPPQLSLESSESGEFIKRRSPQIRQRPSTPPLSGTEPLETREKPGTSTSSSSEDNSVPFVCTSRYNNEFEEMSPLGKGGFGQVVLARNCLDGRQYAIKKVRLSSSDHWRPKLVKVLREVKILALLDHPNIVRYYQAWLEYATTETSTKNRDGTLAGDLSTVGFISTSLREDSHGSYLSDEEDYDETTTLELNANNSRVGKTPPSLSSFVSRKKRFKNQMPTLPTTDEDHSQADMHSPGDGLSFEPYIMNGKTFDAYLNQSSVTLDMPSVNESGFDWDYEVDTEKEESEIPLCTPIDSTTCPSPDTSSVSLPGASTVAGSSSEWKPKPRKAKAARKRTVYDLFLYIQMQFCSEKTLLDYLAAQGREFDSFRVLRIFVQIAKALHHVHERGLIHRDLKPANIFMTEEGTIKLGDFGLSRQVDNLDEQDGGSGQQFAGDNTAGVGTLLYASPEQMAGRAYDAKTDLYSLGMILFEMCHPRFVTSMERVEVLKQARLGRYPEYWTLPEENPVLHHLIQQLLAKQPDARPSATEVLAQCELLQIPKQMKLGDDLEVHRNERQGNVLLRVEAREDANLLIDIAEAVKRHGNGVRVSQCSIRTKAGVAVYECLLESPEAGEVEAIIAGIRCVPSVRLILQYNV